MIKSSICNLFEFKLYSAFHLIQKFKYFLRNYLQIALINNLKQIKIQFGHLIPKWAKIKKLSQYHSCVSKNRSQLKLGAFSHHYFFSFVFFPWISFNISFLGLFFVNVDRKRW